MGSKNNNIGAHKANQDKKKPRCNTVDIWLQNDIRIDVDAT